MSDYWHRKARKIVEEKTGIPLTPEWVVHHIDGNPKNNNIKNLKVMTHEERCSITHAGRRKKRDSE